MADRRDGQARRRGDRSYHDGKDRRHDWDEPRDRGDSRRHIGARDHGTDRDRDRDHRRYRSRSRDRAGRRRSRSPGRERGHDRRDADRDRERERERGHRRREEDKAEPQRERGDRSARGEPARPERDKPSHGVNRVRDGRTATEFPRRSASPNRVFERDTDDHPQLPTRSKPSSTIAPIPPAPVSFKVKGRDGSHGPEPRQQSTSSREDSQEQQQRSLDDEERRQSRGRFDSEPMDEDEEDVFVEDDGLNDMAAMMGFGGFGTTKGKKVLGNNVGAARKEKKTEYRQYMNRVGGFNRPLSPTR
ncbi:hypothetical protein N657DRAFT_687900 [Parathielavia appendiculata]|uniref:U4/U6.U5 small nuclear ribonucleoprotein 27kDa protein domain-containing protein n=1 Tax=Parathielavia appendiculata TaxID=2587402 RepID=A0AAN6Z7A5_9PEZI|nr:hypothetical protein N657DRAFT_687900 [Parathielavia appendiculata]